MHEGIVLLLYHDNSRGPGGVSWFNDTQLEELPLAHLQLAAWLD